ncbi:hypothetical protein KI387_016248, partial [Taxus chinensis]
VEAKKAQWKIIQNIAVAHFGILVIIGGDFNIVLFSHEKQGANTTLDASTANMLDCIQRMHLVDIQTQNGLMTWSNKRIGESCIMERLDKFLISEDWFECNIIPMANVLDNSESDHRP